MADALGQPPVVAESAQTHTPPDPRAGALAFAQVHAEELRQRTVRVQASRRTAVVALHGVAVRFGLPHDLGSSWRGAPHRVTIPGPPPSGAT